MTGRSIRNGFLEEVRELQLTGETEQHWKFPETTRNM